MDDYKVLYQAHGCDFLYGYAESLGEAIELRDKCATEGWRKIKIKRWYRHQWVTVNLQGGNYNEWTDFHRQNNDMACNR